MLWMRCNEIVSITYLLLTYLLIAHELILKLVRYHGLWNFSKCCVAPSVTRLRLMVRLCYSHRSITTTTTTTIYGPLSGTTQVSRYQKKHSPIHHPDHNPIFISFFHLLRSIASSLFKLRVWQSFCTTSLRVLFGLPFGLEPSTSYSIGLHFFTYSQCLLFTTHAHTIATCFAVVPR